MWIHQVVKNLEEKISLRGEKSCGGFIKWLLYS